MYNGASALFLLSRPRSFHKEYAPARFLSEPRICNPSQKVNGAICKPPAVIDLLMDLSVAFKLRPPHFFVVVAVRGKEGALDKNAISNVE